MIRPIHSLGRTCALVAILCICIMTPFAQDPVPEYQDQNITGINTEPAHATMMVYPDEQSARTADRPPGGHNSWRRCRQCRV